MAYPHKAMLEKLFNTSNTIQHFSCDCEDAHGPGASASRGLLPRGDGVMATEALVGRKTK